ncbi:PQQ-binding-like beta-propeller repeat protein [Streptomyces sp. TP-A0356]|uniref:PQQ-binding-like beta-propeller repeat protein n=1 Tax=Streptomyces sp. TP-A0356 TaxID=1359208 RepID=UPI00131BC3FD|nr:PQQ-binding-like beta-propeller repeat protein [Streptomyces sp. TP-A0356]
MDASTEKKRWIYPVNLSVHSTPMLVGGLVYFGCEDRYLYAIDANSVCDSAAAPRSDHAFSPQPRMKGKSSMSLKTVVDRGIGMPRLGHARYWVIAPSGDT